MIKLGTAALSGSVGVLSEGVHSFLDLISAAVAYFTIREAVKPADKEHPFGHGKFETLSSLLESLLLVAAAIWIIYEGITHLLQPRELKYQGLAIATMSISVLLSYCIYRHNDKAADLTESSAIRVNALHFFSDVLASGGVLLALVLIELTGWWILDPLVAFAVAAYILFITAKQVQSALLELTDTQLPVSEIQQIQNTLQTFQNKMLGVHDLRTRRSGAIRHIDFHLVVCGLLSVRDSHSLCDEMEEKLLEIYPNSSIQIHVEPCEHEKLNCDRVCSLANLYERK